jgi:hypothetical protein
VGDGSKFFLAMFCCSCGVVRDAAVACGRVRVCVPHTPKLIVYWRAVFREILRHQRT